MGLGIIVMIPRRFSSYCNGITSIKQQFGFRKNRRTVERQIVENANEHEVSLHFSFVDCKAAFYTIWRLALYRPTGVDPNITSLIETMYDNVECAVVNNCPLT